MLRKGEGKFKAQNDVAVQGTNDSSIVSKCSMASLGFFKDDFLRHFVTKTSRRAPLINRGYYVRARAIDDLLQKFLTHFASQENQIISLGAGFDSTFFRLEECGVLTHTSFYEVDFPPLVRRKAALIRGKAELHDILQKPAFHDSDDKHSTGVVLSSDNYHLFGVDLKDLPALQKVFQENTVNFDLPTLFLSECVITYIDTESSDNLIRWAANLFPNSMFLSYEQVIPDDPFGFVMQQHFKKLNSPLNAIQKYSTMEKHCCRYRQQGWAASSAINMYQYYSQVIPQEERRRVEGLELFDEFEEWHLKCVHYIVVAAFNGSCAAAKDHMFPCPTIPQQEYHSTRAAATLPVKPHPLKSAACPSAWLGVFSHASVAVPGTQQILVSGGFGDIQGCHGRIDSVHLLDTAQNSLTEVACSSGSEKLGPRMHHSVTAFSSQRFLVFGGRTSPAKPCLNTHILTLLYANHRPHYSLHTLQGNQPPPRWRHTASVVMIEGRETVLVFGGRGVQPDPLGDCWLLDVDTLSWNQLQFKGQAALAARHSHVATSWKGSEVIVSGGMGVDSTPLGSLVVISMATMSCSTKETTPPLQPRYSHTAHIVDDQLILVGGVNPMSSAPPSLTIIHLISGVLQELNLQDLSPEYPMMLHNHTSHWLQNNEGVLVIGGGGNCFSFGTHLNKTPVMIVNPLQTTR